MAFVTTLAARGAAKTLLAAAKLPTLVRTVGGKLLQWAQSVEIGLEHDVHQLKLVRRNGSYFLTDPHTGEVLIELQLEDTPAPPVNTQNAADTQNTANTQNAASAAPEQTTTAAPATAAPAPEPETEPVAAEPTTTKPAATESTNAPETNTPQAATSETAQPANAPAPEAAETTNASATAAPAQQTTSTRPRYYGKRVRIGNTVYRQPATRTLPK